MAIPNKIKIHIHSPQYDNSDKIDGYMLYDVDLTNEAGEDLWLEHPVHGTKIDVIVIPFEIPADSYIKEINISKSDEVNLQPGDDLFVLGYPFSFYSTPIMLPIWKRASLASEYAVNIDDMPKFYIDTATAKGMSGAPVIAQNKIFYQNNGIWQYSLDRTFVGVYTGRLANWELSSKKAKNEYDIFDAQIGIVWRASVIEEIIRQKKNQWLP